MTGLQRLDLWLRCVTPFAITLLLALLPVVPLGTAGDTGAMPFLTLMAVYYWTIYRPDLMPPAAVFLIGLAQDLVAGGIPGVTSLILLGTYHIVRAQRRTFLGKPFPVAWWGFMMVAAVASLIGWLLGSVYGGEIVGLGRPLLQFLATWALFPTLVWFFVRTHRRVLRQV